MFMGYPRPSSGGRCRRAWGHDGGTPGYLTSVLASDHGGRVVVVATNGASDSTGRALSQVASDLFCR
jgi:hypothetical protein